LDRYIFVPFAYHGKSANDAYENQKITNHNEPLIQY
jgi:hypothetical protein